MNITIPQVFILAGVIIFLLAWKLSKKSLPFSKPTTLFIGVLLIGAGIYLGGYIDVSGIQEQELSTDYTSGLTGIIYLKDLETRTPIAGKTLSLYLPGVKLQDIQAGIAVPKMTCSAVTDANGKTTFTGLEVGTYIIAFTGDESAFDGTDYMAGCMEVSISSVAKDLKTKETYFEPNDTLYVKKIGDAFYQISAVSGTSSGSGVDVDATMTENGTSGTTVYLTISSATNQAWLTDSNYICRVYLYGVFTDLGGANTAISLSDCKYNSSSGQNITKDSSGTYYIDIPGEIVKNTTTNTFKTFQFILWVPDLGSVNTTADTFAITAKITLVRKDGQVNVLQDPGRKITITQAN